MDLIPTSGFKVDKEEMDLLSYLEAKTGAFAKDCIIDNKREVVIFVVEKANLGRVIGKGGNTIKSLRTALHRDVEVVGFAPEFENFVKSLFHPAEIKEIRKKSVKNSENIDLEIIVPKKDVGRAIGKSGRILERARLILDRHYDNFGNIRVSAYEAPVEQLMPELPKEYGEQETDRKSVV